MKHKVIGWTNYDNYELSGDYPSLAAENAIKDDIIENGYEFTGWYHQEGLYGVPVLNSGKMCVYSQRGFGRVMAEAHGYTGRMDYALFSFPYDEDCDAAAPNKSYSEDDFVDEATLYEAFELEVDECVFSTAKKTGEIILTDLVKFRYIDAGDTLILYCGDSKESFTVKDVSMDLDVTEEEKKLIEYGLYSSEAKERADKLYLEADKILKVQLELL